MHAHRFWAAHKTTQWREEKTNTPINMHARTSDHQPATCDRSASWRWDKRRERSDGLWPRRPPPPLIDPNRELESMSEHPPTRGGETPPQNPTRKRARGSSTTTTTRNDPHLTGRTAGARRTESTRSRPPAAPGLRLRPKRRKPATEINDRVGKKGGKKIPSNPACTFPHGIYTAAHARSNLPHEESPLICARRRRARREDTSSSRTSCSSSCAILYWSAAGESSRRLAPRRARIGRQRPREGIICLVLCLF
jgi:hypothetical protein